MLNTCQLLLVHFVCQALSSEPHWRKKIHFIHHFPIPIILISSQLWTAFLYFYLFWPSLILRFYGIFAPTLSYFTCVFFNTGLGYCSLSPPKYNPWYLSGLIQCTPGSQFACFPIEWCSVQRASSELLIPCCHRRMYWYTEASSFSWYSAWKTFLWINLSEHIKMWRVLKSND